MVDRGATLVPGTSAQAAISLAEQLRETVVRIVITPIVEASVSLMKSSIISRSTACQRDLACGGWRQQGRLLG